MSLIVVLVLIAGGFALFILSANGDDQQEVRDEDFKQVNFSSAMTEGSEDAKAQLIQYSDFLCPSCTVVSTQIMPSIEEKYILTGKVAFEFRPMAFVARTAATNDGSMMASQGAYCAVDQDKFWEYHDAVYGYTYDKIIGSGVNPQYVATSTEVLTTDTLKSLASDAGLEAAAFETCLDDEVHKADATNSNQAANNNGITSAPTVLLNGIDVSNSATNLAALEALIEAQLK